jgi:endonuclease YncB( thermonuclease family)
MNGRLMCGLMLAILAGVPAFAQPPADAVVVRVSRVIDGDTVVLVGSRAYVRYLGIDTPEEGQPFYHAATSANRGLTWRRDVYLEFGPERYDSYGRWLAYLWVEVDGQWVMVNEELLRQGLAKLLVFWPAEERHYERFRRAVTLAQVDKLGLWSRFPNPLSLAIIEADPVKYVLQAVTVVFTVGRIAESGEGSVLWASGSRFGFHVVVPHSVWAELGLRPSDLVGTEVVITGELTWENLAQGPAITVGIPEQWGHQ